MRRVQGRPQQSVIFRTLIETASPIPTNQPHSEFLTFVHNLVSTSFRWTALDGAMTRLLHWLGEEDAAIGSLSEIASPSPCLENSLPGALRCICGTPAGPGATRWLFPKTEVVTAQHFR